MLSPRTRMRFRPALGISLWRGPFRPSERAAGVAWPDRDIPQISHRERREMPFQRFEFRTAAARFDDGTRRRHDGADHHPADDLRRRELRIRCRDQHVMHRLGAAHRLFPDDGVGIHGRRRKVERARHLGPARLGENERGDHRRAHVVDRLAMSRPAGRDGRVHDLPDMPLHHGGHERALVGKVLVERADRDAGAIRHLLGGDGFESIGQQNLNSRLEYGIDGDAGSPLLRLFSGNERLRAGAFHMRIVER